MKYSNGAQNLDIYTFLKINCVIKNAMEPTIKAILKNKENLDIVAIKKKLQNDLLVFFKEMFKIKSGMLDLLMNDVFEVRDKRPYNLRLDFLFVTESVNTVFHGSESISFLWPKILFHII